MKEKRRGVGGGTCREKNKWSVWKLVLGILLLNISVTFIENLIAAVKTISKANSSRRLHVMFQDGMETIQTCARELWVDFTPAVFYKYLGAVASIYQVIIPTKDPYWRPHALCGSRNRVMLLFIKKTPFFVDCSRVLSKKLTTFI